MKINHTMLMSKNERDIEEIGLYSKYRKRILVSKGYKFFSIKIGDVACFLYEDKITYAITFDSTKYIIDMSLNKIEEEIDSLLFFRANRKSIININAFDFFEFYFNGKLVIKLKINIPVKIFVSKYKATSFKDWLGK